MPDSNWRLFACKANTLNQTASTRLLLSIIIIIININNYNKSKSAYSEIRCK